MKQAIGLLFFRVVFQQYLLSVCISLLTSFPETIEIVCLRCTSHVVRDAHLVVLDMCISCSMERDNSFHKV